MAQLDQDPRTRPEDHGIPPRMWAALAAAVVALIGAILIAVLPGGDEDATPTTTTLATTTTALPSTTAAPTTKPGPVDEYRGRYRTSEFPIRWGGIDRNYTTMEPVKAGGRRPVVMVLHGLGGSAASTIAIAPWPRLVVDHDVMIVFAEAAPSFVRSWNAGVCCPPANQMGIDDIGYLGAVLDEVAARPDVNAEEIYLSGYSNGGFMAYRALCTYADRFAGALVVMATNMAGCDPNAPINLNVIHGTADAVVPYNGGLATSSLLLQGGVFRPVYEGVAAFAKAGGCEAEPTFSEAGRLGMFRWDGCAEERYVQLTRVDGLGHDPPTLPDVNSVDAVISMMGL